MKRISCVIVLFFIGLISTETISDLEEKKQQVQTMVYEAINNKTVLKEYIKRGLSNDNIFCLDNATAETLSSLSNLQEETAECLSTLVNVTKLRKEIDVSGPAGEIDSVFKKYCQRFNETGLGCLRKYADFVSQNVCGNFYDFIYNTIDNLLQFVCHKEGDRIALFLAAKGDECFKEKFQEISECYQGMLNENETLENIDAMKVDVENVTAAIQTIEDTLINSMCKNFVEAKQCVVPKIETCSDPTPANIAESLLNYYLKNSCSEKLQNMAITGDNSNSSSSASASIVAIVAALLYINLF